MIDPITVLTRVFMLVLLMLPGYILKKLNICGDSTAKGIANIIIYVAQPALLINSYITAFSPSVLYTAVGVLVFSLISHGLFFVLSLLFFRKVPLARQRVLRYAAVFSNTGFMGIPLIISLFDASAALYVSFYIIGFSLYQWSLGCLLFTGDKKYLSVKKIFVNPATIPIYIGLLIFFLPIETYIPSVVTDLLTAFQNTVAPLSMLMTGIRLAEVKFRDIIRDKYMYELVFIRLLLFPAVIWAVMKLTAATGIYSDALATAITLIAASTPTATATGIFAEKFGGDAPYAGQAVAFTTLVSVLTMPVTALLLLI